MAPKRQDVILLVDGYNIIGAWPELRPEEGEMNFLELNSAADLEHARQRLIEQLINFSAFEGYSTTLVFDAHARDTPASKEVLTPNLAVYYTEFRETADTYIEKFCAGHQHNHTLTTRILVATSDRAQQLTVGGFGAEWMSARQLVNRLQSSSHRARDRYRRSSSGAGRFLFNSLDPESQARLSALRHGKLPNT
jgi:uncharacterized protein